MNRLLFILCCFLSSVAGFKYLFLALNIAPSHVNFIGKWADILVEEGHQVDFVLRKLNLFVNTNGTKLSNITIFTPPRVNEISELFADLPMHSDVFTESGDVFTTKGMQILTEVFKVECEDFLKNKYLLSKLKAANYDGVFIEHVEKCGFYISELVAKDKPIFLVSAQGLSYPSRKWLNFHSPPGLIPVYNEVLPSGPRLNLFDRFWNFIQYVRYFIYIPNTTGFSECQDIFITQNLLPKDFPSFKEITNKVVYMYLNSIESLSFPDAYTNQIKHVGGPLTKETGEIDDFLKPVFDNAKKGVIVFSFGTIVDTSKMNPVMRQFFIDAFSKFKDYTFIWQIKNSDSEEIKDLFKSSPNIIPVSWFNQPAVLAHPKTVCMISHGGLGSLMESATFGVPMVSIPMFMDHKRSAALAKYYGYGVYLDKYTLSTEKIEEAITEIVEKKEYRNNAVLLSNLIESRPEKPRKIFLDSVEFGTRFHKYLTKTNLPSKSVIEVYCLDIVALFLLTVVILLYLIVRLLQKLKLFIFQNENKKSLKKIQ